MGARTLVATERAEAAKARPQVFKPTKHIKQGGVTNAERQFVRDFVADQPAEVTENQTRALATVMRRSPETIKTLIQSAREDFVSSAKDYVAIHKQAVMTALASGDPKALDVAVRGAQWALENISAEGQRVVDNNKHPVNSGPRILVGVKIGGMNKDLPIVTTQVIEGESGGGPDTKG